MASSPGHPFRAVEEPEVGLSYLGRCTRAIFLAAVATDPHVSLSGTEGSETLDWYVSVTPPLEL